MATIHSNTGPSAIHTFVVEEQALDVPIWVRDLASFRKWYYSADVPEQGPRICFFNGQVWIDMSREQIFTHAHVKTEYSNVLGPLIKKEKKGRYFGDGVQLTHVASGLSAQPDGTFISNDTFVRQHDRWGNPEFTLEVS